MIYLRHQSIDLDIALKAHTDYFYSVVLKKLELSFKTSSSGYGTKSHYDSCQSVKEKDRSSKFNELKNWLSGEDRIEKIISGNPDQLFAINETFKSFVDCLFGCGTYNLFLTPKEKRVVPFDSYMDSFFKNISQVFDYNFLGQDKAYTSYTLTENLGVRTCVYCNRNYSLTQTKRDPKKGRLMNPQLDHYFPQSKYPLLQISFFNLIPSCDICNSRVKNDFDFDLNIHTHPYQRENPDFYFSYRPRFTNEDKGYQIYFHADNAEGQKAKTTAEAMLTDRIYEAHQYELEDLIKLKKAYSEKYLDTLQSFFPGTTFEEVYRLIIGTEMLPMNFHKRPFSKFKSDILNELRKIT